MEYAERRNCAPALMALWIVSSRWLELSLWSVIWAPNRNLTFVGIGRYWKPIARNRSDYYEVVCAYRLTLPVSRYEAVSISDASTGPNCRRYSAKNMGDLSTVGRGLFQVDMKRFE